MNGHRRQTGFSLIETLVAFVLLSSALAVILQLFSSGLAGTLRAENHSRAMVLGDGLLAALGREEPMQPGQREGSSGPLHWRMQITPAAAGDDGDAPGDWALYRIDLTLLWPQGTRQQTLHLATLRLGPVR